MASSAEMSLASSSNITHVEGVQLLRAQLGAQRARLEAVRSETETNRRLERELEEARTQLAAARAEIGLLPSLSCGIVSMPRSLKHHMGCLVKFLGRQQITIRNLML